jgi:hypothetical protein
MAEAGEAVFHSRAGHVYLVGEAPAATTITERVIEAADRSMLGIEGDRVTIRLANVIVEYRIVRHYPDLGTYAMELIEQRPAEGARP